MTLSCPPQALWVERARLGVRVGASEHGWVAWYYVHAEGSGLGGDSPGPWPCHWHARITQRHRVGELEPKTVFLGYVNAEHAPEGRLVAPNLWATLSVHVVASPGSHGAPEVGGLTVHSFSRANTNSSDPDLRANRWLAKKPRK